MSQVQSLIFFVLACVITISGNAIETAILIFTGACFSMGTSSAEVVSIEKGECLPSLGSHKFQDQEAVPSLLIFFSFRLCVCCSSLEVKAKKFQEQGGRPQPRSFLFLSRSAGSSPLYGKIFQNHEAGSRLNVS
jgi:hypothetical protein